MHRQWIHDDLAVAKKRREYARHIALRSRQSYRIRRLDIPAPAQAKPLNVAVIIFLASIITMLITVPLVIVKSRGGAAPLILAAELPEINPALLEPHSRDMLYTRLSSTQKRGFSDLVRYVTNIIQNSRSDSTDADDLAYTIVAESLAANYDPLLVASLILAESSFRKHVSSSMGALGLMQIKPSTGRYVSSIYGVKWTGPASLKDPQYNIQLGIAYLKYLEELFQGNMTHALIAYNWGPGNMLAALQSQRKHVPRGSLAYSRKILKNHSTWRADLGLQKVQPAAASWSRG